MNYLRGFVPWITFAAVSTVGWQWGALAALALGAWLITQERRAGVTGDALILQWSTVVYFTALTAFSFARQDSGLQHYTGALSLGWLAVTAWTTLAAKRPFTLGIARRQAPASLWDNPVFLRINVVLTSVWAAAFTVTAAILTAVSAAHLGTSVAIPVQVAGFILPALFTARYPDRVRARMTGTAAAPAANGFVTSATAADGQEA
jgi:hypothetical protein